MRKITVETSERITKFFQSMIENQLITHNQATIDYKIDREIFVVDDLTANALQSLFTAVHNGSKTIRMVSNEALTEEEPVNKKPTSTLLVIKYIEPFIVQDHTEWNADNTKTIEYKFSNDGSVKNSEEALSNLLTLLFHLAMSEQHRPVITSVSVTNA